MGFRNSLALLSLVAGLSVPARAQITTEQEIILGREAANRFEARYGLAKDAAMQARVQRIGARLAPFNSRKDVPLTFKVCDMKSFNALAFPGGFIYATKGLMKGLDDEQLAFVLGHEVTHVSHRHSMKQMGRGRLRKVGLLAAIVGLNGGQQMEIAQMVDAVVTSQYSQADESDADATGIATMAAAGYDPANAILALRTLGKQKGATPGFMNTLVGSHPMTSDRIRQALDIVPTVAFKPAPPPSGFDAEWNETLRHDVALAASGAEVDPNLSAQLEKRISTKTAPPSHSHSETRVLAASVTLPAYETQFLSKELALVAQRTRRFGMSVVQKSDGSREVYLFWP